MKHSLSVLLLVATLAGPLRSIAAESGSAREVDAGQLRTMLEAIRSDFSGFKIRLLNDVMGLTGAEAEQFWPVYRQYEKELAALGDRRVALVKEYGELRRSGKISSEAWTDLSKKWLANAQDRVDLWKSYSKKISKAVSPMRAAQFLQVEHQMALLIDLNIASEMPVLGH